MTRRVLPWLLATLLVVGMAAVVPVSAASNRRDDQMEQQKKKKKKPKPPPVCAAYVPGEQGADAETSIVTDAATEEAPVEVTIPTAAGFGLLTIVGGPDESSHAFLNIQVDSALPAAGLYARFSFDTLQDYDLYLRDSAGVDVASATGFNPENAVLGPTDGDAGGHSEGDSETLVGISSPDCQGYTLDVTGFLTEGGDHTLTLWLGEVQYTPGG